MPVRDDANRVFVNNFPHSKLPSQGLRRRAAWWQVWN